MEQSLCLSGHITVTAFIVTTFIIKTFSYSRVSTCASAVDIEI